MLIIYMRWFNRFSIALSRSVKSDSCYHTALFTVTASASGFKDFCQIRIFVWSFKWEDL